MKVEGEPARQQSGVPELGDLSLDDFQLGGERLLDWIKDYLSGIDDLPVSPPVNPGFLQELVPRQVPETGEPLDRILDDLDRVLMTGMNHWNHPRFFGYFNSSGSIPGILAELLTAAFNVNTMSWQSCPVGTELEELVLDWLRQMVGLPPEFRGVITEGGSLSNFLAIVSALDSLAELELRERGMAGRTDLPKLRLYASEDAHSSIDKAAIASGLGLASVRKIPVDDAWRMRPDDLERSIDEDRTMGRFPFCVIGTVGSTSSTSIDPIPAIADICERERLWLHVDAAHAGIAAIEPGMGPILDGCDRADSIVVNPHKWMFVPLDLSVLLTRRPEVFKQAFTLTPEYLRDDQEGIVENYMDHGLTLGRRFRALKLWFVIRAFGRQGLAARIREHVRIAGEFANWVDLHPRFVRLAPVPLSTVCFRAEPSAWDEEELDRYNEALLQAVNQTGHVFLTHTRLRGRYTIRLVVSQLRTTIQDVRRAWEIIQREEHSLNTSRSDTST